MGLVDFLGSSGGGSFAGNLVGGLFNVGSTLLTNRANLKLADHQFDQNVKMWNMQNEYNKPAAQMARLKEAGLNPNLLYGTGTAAATGNSSSMPQYQAPTMQAPQIAGNLFNLASALEDYRAKKLGNDLTEKQMNTEEAKAVSLQAQAEAHKASAEKDLYYVEQGKTMLPLLKDKTIAETKKIQSAIQNDAALRAEIKKKIDYMEEQIQNAKVDRANKLALIERTYAEIDLILARKGLVTEQTRGQKISNFWNDLGVSGNQAEILARQSLRGMIGLGISPPGTLDMYGTGGVVGDVKDGLSGLDWSTPPIIEKGMELLKRFFSDVKKSGRSPSGYSGKYRYSPYTGYGF